MSVLSKQYSVLDLYMLRDVEKDTFYKVNKCREALTNFKIAYQPIFNHAKDCKTYEELAHWIEFEYFGLRHRR